MGGSYLTRVTSFQLDREVLDAHVAGLTRELGAHWWRPASVRSVELAAGGLQTLVIKCDGTDHTVRARWVVDASGRHCMLARRNGWHTPTPDHQTSSVWARFRDVGDFDGRGLIERHPELGRGVFGMRHPATNHLMGEGWWAWMIPLKNGDMSIGVTWDRRRFDWPRAGSLGEQLRAVIESHPVGKEIIRDAEIVDGDLHTLRNLPYTSTTYAGDGFVLVGDAGGFIDPFYSMGLDSLAMSSTSAVRMIVADYDGKPVAPEVDRHNATFHATYRRWFEGIYRDKYRYMGDYELMYVAFILEVGMYYLGVVRGPYVNGKGALLDGVFYRRASLPAYALLRHVGRRLASMARVRQARGHVGPVQRGPPQAGARLQLHADDRLVAGQGVRGVSQAGSDRRPGGAGSVAGRRRGGTGPSPSPSRPPPEPPASAPASADKNRGVVTTLPPDGGRQKRIGFPPDAVIMTRTTAARRAHAEASTPAGVLNRGPHHGTPPVVQLVLPRPIRLGLRQPTRHLAHHLHRGVDRVHLRSNLLADPVGDALGPAGGSGGGRGGAG